MTLADVLTSFLDVADESDADALGNAIRRLSNESARCVADHTAVEDALAEFAIEISDAPLTPMRLQALLKAARAYR